jgi:hypothetical protein
LITAIDVSNKDLSKTSNETVVLIQKLEGNVELSKYLSLVNFKGATINPVVHLLKILLNKRFSNYKTKT